MQLGLCAWIVGCSISTLPSGIQTVGHHRLTGWLLRKETRYQNRTRKTFKGNCFKLPRRIQVPFEAFVRLVSVRLDNVVP